MTDLLTKIQFCYQDGHYTHDALCLIPEIVKQLEKDKEEIDNLIDWLSAWKESFNLAQEAMAEARAYFTMLNRDSCLLSLHILLMKARQ